jgi:hypothetical protein
LRFWEYAKAKAEAERLWNVVSTLLEILDEIEVISAEGAVDIYVSTLLEILVDGLPSRICRRNIGIMFQPFLRFWYMRRA